MRCRSIVNGEVVWFGSTGLDKTQPVYNSNNELVGYKAVKTNSFSENQQAISDSLTQRLSIFKNELWYRMNYGLSLFEKVKSKVFIDSEITSIIMSHPDVLSIQSFSSNIVDKKYTFDCVIISTYGKIDINSSEITV